MSTVQTQPLSPVPSMVPPLEYVGTIDHIQNQLAQTWMQWFVDLYTKVNTINGAIVPISGLTGPGLVALDSSNNAFVRTITGTTNQIDVSHGDGASGNPTISIDPVFFGSVARRVSMGW